MINALKGLSQGENLEEYLDTDEIISYCAAHNFVLNYDSYTGNMLHNYYLYEKDGKLAMLPWDYNLAFGGFGGGFGAGFGAGIGAGSGTDFETESGADFEARFGADRRGERVSDATSLINTGIDTPLSGAGEESRPMWAWIVKNEEYLSQYHQVYEELLENYFESGAFEKQMESVYEMILPYIEKDTGAFYNVEEFKVAFENLKTFCELRAGSIRAQLDGTLSTETDKQDADSRISAADLSLDVMGSHRGGWKK